MTSNVEKNSEQIADIYKKLDYLTKFATRVKEVIQEQKHDIRAFKDEYQRDIKDLGKAISNSERHAQLERENLVLRLQNELLKLESRLNSKTPGSLQVIEGGQQNPLSEGRDEGQG